MVLEFASSSESRWRSLPADQVCTKITKGTTPPKSEIVADQRIPFVRVNNLTVGGGNGLAGGVIYVTAEAHRGILARSIAKPGDILMNIVGPPLGKLTLLDDEFAEYNLNQAVLIFRPDTSIVSREFLFAYLCSEIAQTWLEGRSKKTSGQQNLTIEVCKELSIPLPPLPEQQKIAEILGTWDKAIQTTEALLANARTQKRALMQTLLTGTRRFPGFEDHPWREVRLGDVGTTYGGLTGKTKEDFGSGSSRYIPYLNIFQNNRIDPSQLVAVDIGPTERQNRVKYGDVFFTTSSETPEEVGMSSVLLDDLDDVFLNSFCFGFRPHDFNILRPRFAQFFFRGTQFRSDLYQLAQGATRYNLSKTALMNVFIRLPSPKEQDAIADLLVVAETDENSMVHQLDCLRTEKKSLMQQLLTGKRRVVV